MPSTTMSFWTSSPGCHLMFKRYVMNGHHQPGPQPQSLACPHQPPSTEQRAVLVWVTEIMNQKSFKRPGWQRGGQQNLCPKHEMMGENYPEKDYLRMIWNSRCEAAVPRGLSFFWLLASPKRVRWAQQVGTQEIQSRGEACPFSSSSRWQAFSRK